MKIAVVGSGTAGLIAAITLKNRFQNFQVDVIKSDKIGIIGVGEGSTEHWRSFCEFNNISLKELIKETDATFKYGIMFSDWTDKNYFHYVDTDLSNLKLGQYLAGYGFCVKNNLDSKKYTYPFCWDNKISLDNLSNQFHFNTTKLNNFLIKKCKEVGVNFFEDEIKEIVVTNKIEYLKGNKYYEYDFYIDCTGFKKILISKLGAKWISYKEYLPMNEAIAFPTEDTDEYPPYTLAKAMSAGWMWRIPTNGRWGNGYVYNNNYLNCDEAQKECENFLGKNINIAKNIKFEAGSLDKAWISNCVAIGLSSSFIEPLEASSIGTSIQQTFLLIHLINNYQQKDIDMYNKKFSSIVENIRDFVLLHYLCGKKDSKFWREFKPKLPDSLKDILEKSKSRLLIKEDFDNEFLLFTEENFTVVLKELNLINLKKISNEYDNLSKNLKTFTEKHVTEILNKKHNIISHKQFLKRYSQ
jgi:tryptophan halogenase|tara:strand:+ start:12 stop:1418 length:1407 start_codon:yes stop_codon:yes gene_type:complete